MLLSVWIQRDQGAGMQRCRYVVCVWDKGFVHWPSDDESLSPDLSVAISHGLFDVVEQAINSVLQTIMPGFTPNQSNSILIDI